MQLHLETLIDIPPQNVVLKGDLTIPAGATAIVIFAHGSGSSRLSPRNTAVAKHLNDNKFATLLFDLLTEAEDLDYDNRFDIDLLADRLARVTEWVKRNGKISGLPLGYFGASTGAAAALKAAAALSGSVQAIVSRGGRPDMAGDQLPNVTAPTLLIVGGDDTEVLTLNELAYDKLTCEKRLEVVPGATHLFEEPGTMDEVIELATEWFDQHLVHVAKVR